MSDLSTDNDRNIPPPPPEAAAWLARLFGPRLRTKTRASGYLGAACAACSGPGSCPVCCRPRQGIRQIEFEQGATGFAKSLRIERGGRARIMVELARGEAWYAPDDLEFA